ncbi:hypothetical protein M501DRAFT_1010858 [Patellaria atrata CBS 101060]|uniref:Nudix hydrolase domain-containing protein n=1 Tax=Patellaria atrata CBS 101060 TaxID=1346257 RepID=A0A9P4VRX1_9PEZI|nr:hypothetical protein M501DRAFT_1010858 [Patellaria atrata CBS 101060]
MVQSRFSSSQYFSDSFVESAGAVLFRLSTREICILHLLSRDEYVLPKGRRNCGETRQNAAVREVREETGYVCRILPVNISTRNPPAMETEHVPDEPRLHEHTREPFALQVRRLGDGMKVVWWYVAAVNEEEGYTDVLDKLTFAMDRVMVERAIELVEGTYGGGDTVAEGS